MTYKAAASKLKQVGCSRASREALTAMYAQLLESIHGGKAQHYYDYLCKQADADGEAKILLADRAKAWMALID